MKFCKSCGAELADEAVMCPKCGQPAQDAAPAERKQNTLGLVGFILSFFTGPLAFIFSLVGLIQGKKKGDKISLAIAGLIISAIECVIIIIIYASIIGAAASLGGAYSMALALL